MMTIEDLDKDRSVAAVASDYRCSWRTAHDHVVAVADAVLAAEPTVVVLGIDETRRWSRHRRPIGLARREGDRRPVPSGQEEDIAAAWIAKELLCELLSCAERGGLRYEIHAALDRFYRLCACGGYPRS